MQRQPVTSSDIKSIGYDKNTSILEIEFNSSGIYQYFNVPENIHNGIMLAPSKGTYFHQHIKDKFTCKKV